jgi:hypothetical protein
VIAIQLCELRERLLGLGACARDEGDPVISLGRGHGIDRLIWALTGAAARKVVYTTLAVLVETAGSRGILPGSGDMRANLPSCRSFEPERPYMFGKCCLVMCGPRSPGKGKN